MKPRHAFLSGLLLAAACGGEAAPPPEPRPHSTPRWELTRAYRAAHEAKNVDQALRLVCLDGSDTTTRDTLAKSFREDFEKELVSVELLPLRGNERFEFVIADRRVVPNLKVEKRLRIDFVADDDQGRPARSFTEYFVGSKDGRAMIASSRVAR